jgi:hypothetical protein
MIWLLSSVQLDGGSQAYLKDSLCWTSLANRKLLWGCWKQSQLVELRLPFAAATVFLPTRVGSGPKWELGVRRKVWRFGFGKRLGSGAKLGLKFKSRVFSKRLQAACSSSYQTSYRNAKSRRLSFSQQTVFTTGRSHAVKFCAPGFWTPKRPWLTWATSSNLKSTRSHSCSTIFWSPLWPTKVQGRTSQAENTNPLCKVLASRPGSTNLRTQWPLCPYWPSWSSVACCNRSTCACRQSPGHHVLPNYSNWPWPSTSDGNLCSVWRLSCPSQF